MKKIAVVLAFCIAIFASAFAEDVTYNVIDHGTLAYCQATPSSYCSNTSNAGFYLWGVYNTEDQAFTPDQTGDNEGILLPTLQFKNNQLMGSFCYVHVGKHEFKPTSDFGLCSNNVNYEIIEFIGHYDPDTQLITLSAIVRFHKVTKHPVAANISIVNAVFSPEK